MNFKLHTIESAPDESKRLLEESKQAFGMLPNLHAVMAESPELLEAYKFMHDCFQRTSFDNNELTVVWQTINIENDCHYCKPAHTAVAYMMKVEEAVINALNSGKPLANEKLQVLHETTLSLLRNRGRLAQEELDKFYQQGYQPKQLLEILVGIAQKTMSNYTNHLAHTPVDQAFLPFVEQ